MKLIKNSNADAEFISIVLCGIVMIIGVGLLLYSVALFITTEKEHYENVPYLINKSQEVVLLQLNKEMNTEQKINIISNTCKTYFPIRYGSAVEQSQCSQYLIESLNILK